MTEHRPQRRTRSGCCNCRSRKKKCDGMRPQCSYCLERGERCRYGLKASFHPSRQMMLSAEDSVALTLMEGNRRSPLHHTTQFVDNTAQIVQNYQCPLETQAERVDDWERGQIGPLVPGNPPVLHIDDTALDETNVGSGVAISNEAIVSTAAPTSDDNPDALIPHHSTHASSAEVPSVTVSGPSHLFTSSHPDFVDPTIFEVDLPVPRLEQIELIRAYLQETGTWCEATDTARHFSVSYVRTLMNNKPFAAAAMALASRQLDAVRRSTSDRSLRLYQYAVQSLLHYEPSQCGEATLVCCILLSLYEMMTSDVANWRRHLKGCVFNLTNKGWNGSSPALVGASFWAFARMDVWAAYLLKEKTLIPTDSWVGGDDTATSAATQELESYCNLTTLLLAEIVNLLADGYSPRPVSALVDINALWGRLEEWHNQRPLQALPVMRAESTRQVPFPLVLHTGSPSICANTFYHAGCILLLRTGLVQNRSDNENYDPNWHAKELCGISITNVSHACWVNQVYPLYIAGSALETKPDMEDGQENAAEKFRLLKHLAKIDEATGWPTSSIAALLRRQWGLA